MELAAASETDLVRPESRHNRQVPLSIQDFV